MGATVPRGTTVLGRKCGEAERRTVSSGFEIPQPLMLLNNHTSVHVLCAIALFTFWFKVWQVRGPHDDIDVRKNPSMLHNLWLSVLDGMKTTSLL